MIGKLPQKKILPARGDNLPVINPSVTKPRFRAQRATLIEIDGQPYMSATNHKPRLMTSILFK